MSVVQRVSHLGICVSDLERSIAFYRDGLGFQKVHVLSVEGEPSDTLLQLRDVRLHAVYLERDGLRIELLHYQTPPSPPRAPVRSMNDLGFTHLSLIVADIEANLPALEAAGATIEHATRIRAGDRTVAIMVRDPDGLLLELVARDPTAR